MTLAFVLFDETKPYQQATQDFKRLSDLRESTDVVLSKGEMQAKLTVRVKDLPDEPKLESYDDLAPY